MGRDKALIDVGGRALAVKVTQALTESGAAPVVCVGGDAKALEALNLWFIADLHPGAGPLGGIITALSQEALSDPVMILSVDLPTPDSHAIRRVIDALGPEADVAVPVVEGRHQWLHSAWRKRALGELTQRFSDGERAIHGALSGLTVTEVAGVSSAAVADVDWPHQLDEL